ncbi:hypothetical protein B0675_01250 [Streptomyces sp. M41(2017)]|nr:hypothetical protein B0675_01250 [Streptomyces sp. M41(2017)]
MQVSAGADVRSAAIARLAWPGRPWAVEGRPKATINGHQRPPERLTALRRCPSLKVAPALHHFLRNKKSEWEEYRSEVTAFELRKNLPVL